MSYNLGQQTKKSTRVRHLFVAVLTQMCLRTATTAAAQNVTVPPYSYRHYGTGGEHCIFGGPCPG